MRCFVFLLLFDRGMFLCVFRVFVVLFVCVLSLCYCAVYSLLLLMLGLFAFGRLCIVLFGCLACAYVLFVCFVFV